ncbi:MAG: HAMP domain-containing protein [Verrucomicrobiales bacterium]|nr:HAMP domain-containing protein [Verrucomicrobiales bacterium]
MHSFRWRIALSSALISGLVVLAFGTVAWWSLNRARIADLEAEMRHFGYRVTLRSGRNIDATRLEGSLTDVFGAEKARQRSLILLDAQDGELVRSAGWPAGLDPSRFVPGTEPLDPQPRDEESRSPSDRPAPPPREVMEPRFYPTTSGGRAFLVGAFANRETKLLLAADLDQVAGDMRQLRRAFLVALPGALLIVALGAAFVAWRALRPVTALGEDMRKVSARALDQRLEVAGADREFAAIIGNYNAMLERLERSFDQATRFSADASHELKTPLAVMQATLERSLRDHPDDEATQTLVSQLLEQTGRQRSILESLLLLSRADAGRLEISPETIDLSALLETWLEDASLLAEERDIVVKSEIDCGLATKADPVLMQRVAHNLFSNAVKYNHDGGEIVCRLFREGSWIVWTVANTGDPVPEAERERVFERFFRGEKAKATVSGETGTGLGLSLAREIVNAHGGEIGFGIDAAGRNEVRVRVPAHISSS